MEIQGGVSAEALLGALSRALSTTRAPRARTGLLEFAAHSLQAAPPSPHAPGLSVRACSSSSQLSRLPSL